jgi:hypothetical protein
MSDAPLPTSSNDYRRCLTKSSIALLELSSRPSFARLSLYIYMTYALDTPIRDLKPELIRIYKPPVTEDPNKT